MSEALSKLIEAVATGQAPTGLDVHRADTGHSDHITMVLGAFNGSLDAAKALHEALLPGWAWQVEDEGWATVYRGDATRDQTLIDADAETSARAWLLAILRAYAAQQESTP